MQGIVLNIGLVGLISPVGAEGARGDVFAIGGQHHEFSQRHVGGTSDSNGHILGTLAGDGNGGGMLTHGCGCVGHGNGGTFLGIGLADAGGFKAEYTVLVGQRHGHIASEFSCQHIEGRSHGLAHVGSHRQRLGVNDNFRNNCSDQGHLLDVRSGIRAIDVVSHDMEVVGLAGRQILNGVVLVGNASDCAVVGVSCLAHALDKTATIDFHTIQVEALLAAIAGDGHMLASSSLIHLQGQGIIRCSIG